MRALRNKIAIVLLLAALAPTAGFAQGRDFPQMPRMPQMPGSQLDRDLQRLDRNMGQMEADMLRMERDGRVMSRQITTEGNKALYGVEWRSAPPRDGVPCWTRSGGGHTQTACNNTTGKPDKFQGITTGN